MQQSKHIERIGIKAAQNEEVKQKKIDESPHAAFRENQKPGKIILTLQCARKTFSKATV